MKKTTKAATKKTASKAVKTFAAKKATTKKAAVKKVATKKFAAKKTAASQTANKAAAQAAAVPNVPKTTITAKADIGYGNTLFLRGDAPVLSWSKGVPMDCDENSQWTISIAGVTDPFEFKVLINDDHWSSGPNCQAQPGQTSVVEPAF